MQKTIIIKPLTHKGAEHYGLYFKYDSQLIACAREAGCQFSYSNKCWYIPINQTNLNKLFTSFKEQAWLDLSALKEAIISPKNNLKPTLLPPISASRSAEIQQFEDWLRYKHYSENTISVYTACVEVYFRANPNADPSKITKQEFITFNTTYILK